MSEKPVLHGRDHRIAGADPLPWLGTVPNLSGLISEGVHRIGTLAQRPTPDATNKGSVYIATDGAETPTGSTAISDGVNWIPIASPGGGGAARIAWVLGTTSAFTVPMSIAGAGFGGTDWLPLPLYQADDGGIGQGDTNAYNNDPNHGFGVNNTDADLYNADVRIFSVHYPLIDYGFVSGDKISSIRIRNNWNNYAGAAFKAKLKIALTSAGGSTTAPVEQTFGVMLVGFGGYTNSSVFAAELWGGSGAPHFWSGTSLTAAPASPTDLIQVAGGADDPFFEFSAWTDPAKPEWNIGRIVTVDLDALFAVATDNEGVNPYTDIVVFGCNPGPKDQIVDIALYVENLNQSSQFGEG